MRHGVFRWWIAALAGVLICGRAMAWNDGDFPLSYRLNVVELPESSQRLATVQMRMGLEDWISVDGTRATSCYLGTTGKYGRSDEKILSTWSPLPDPIAGLGMYPPGGRIWYNSRYPFLVRWRHLFLHETGHALGFPHYPGNSVMAQGGADFLTDFDQSLMRSAYPGGKKRVDNGLCSSDFDTSWIHDPNLRKLR